MTKVPWRRPNAMDIENWLLQLGALPHFGDAEHLYDVAEHAGCARLHNLAAYLRLMAERTPRVLLVGEAPGYRGTRRTGIPFVSPAMLAGDVPGVGDFFAGADLQHVDEMPSKPAEVTSAVVWRTVLELPTMPLLWAAYPHHPHLPGNLATNRTPRAEEIAAGRPLLDALIKLFQIEQVVAVGNVAMSVLAQLQIPAAKVRHPARGGAPQFRQQLLDLLAVEPAPNQTAVGRSASR